MLYHTAFIIMNLKNCNQGKKNGIKYNNSLNSIVVRRLFEQHVIEK